MTLTCHRAVSVVILVPLLLVAPQVLPPATAATVTKLAHRPTRSECQAHADDGLCDSHKYKEYMTEYCEMACIDHRLRIRRAALQKEMRKPLPLNPASVADSGDDEEEDSGEGSEDNAVDSEDDEGADLPPQRFPRFFSLSAMDINKKQIFFSDFQGKVTVITNVASECGLTESHYEGMKELYEEFSTTGVFNILAFPCNQFDEQEPGTNAEIKEFAKQAGVEFTMMDKVDVNGPQAHPVYHFLRQAVGPSQIEWNFDVYYVVGPYGSIRSFSGVEPADLRGVVKQLIGRRDEL